MEVGLGLRAARKKERKDLDRECQDTYQPLNATRMHELQVLISDDWMFDAIYVDEAQDFDTEWLEFLVTLLRPGGEMVIAADFKQNIYNSSGASDATHRLPFRGRWRQISDVSERIPGILVPWLNKFAIDHVIGDPEDLPMVPRQGSFDFASMIRWKNFDSETSALSEVCKLVQWLKTRHSKSPEAIALLVPTHRLGSALVKALSNAFGKESVDDVFGDTHRKKKRRMYMGGGRLKASTIHSFKGWDIETVILLWQSSRSSQYEQKALFYTGITRAKVNLFVFNLDIELSHIASEFPRSGATDSHRLAKQTKE
jgi:superfamily I DNA/RNA helicase